MLGTATEVSTGFLIAKTIGLLAVPAVLQTARIAFEEKVIARVVPMEIRVLLKSPTSASAGQAPQSLLIQTTVRRLAA